MYGLTEAFRSTYLPPDEVDRRPDSIGKAIPNAEILVLREDGTPCAAERARRARPSRRAGRPGLLERSGQDGGAVQAAASARDSGLVLPEFAVFSGRHRAQRRGRLSVFHRPTRRNDQDVGLPREPDRDRRSAVCDRPGRRSRGLRRCRTQCSVRRSSSWSPLPPDCLRRRAGAARRMPREAAGLHDSGDRSTCAPVRFRATRTARSIARSLARTSSISTPRRGSLTAMERALPDAKHAAIRAVGPFATTACIVGGIALTRLAERVGRTPFYAYDRGLIRRNASSALRRHLPAGVELHYADQGQSDARARASHGAPRRRARRCVRRRAAGCARCGRDPRDVSFAGPGKQPFELRQAIAAGVLVNVESQREVALLAALSAELQLPARVAVRVNPDFELKSSGMKMGGGRSSSAWTPSRSRRCCVEIDRLGLAFEGFHIFSGSQNLNADAISDAQQKAVELAIRLARGAASKPRIVNIGGGFGIPYFPGEQPLDLAPIGAKLTRLVDRVERELPGAKLVVELGRYLVGEAGLYVCRVVDRKISRGQVFLVTDGGLHHHLAASGNFGQVLRKNYPVVIGNRVAGGTREIASVVGPLCTPLDLLADRMELSAAEPGDLVAVFQSGAYGATASPQAFLSHPPVAETLV